MAAKQAKNATTGRFAYEGLERALHEKARLGLLTSLVAHPEGLLFSELKELCSLTDGNLNRHLKVLEEEGLIEVRKGLRGSRPQTLCRMTQEGRQRFMDYINVLEQVVHDAVRSSRAADKTESAARTLRRGWSPA